jgi:hypothetical protein
MLFASDHMSIASVGVCIACGCLQDKIHIPSGRSQASAGFADLRYGGMVVEVWSPSLAVNAEIIGLGVL